MANIEIVNPLEYPGWDDLILSMEDYSFFHTSAWAKVITESYGYKPIYAAIIDKGRLKGLIPLMEIKSILTGRRGVSLPFSDYCEPLGTTQNVYQRLFNYMTQHGSDSGWKYIELRGGEKFFNNVPASSHYYGHVLDLNPNGDKLFSSFRNSTKRNVKKAFKVGAEIKISNSIDSLREFYRLHCTTRKRHGLPPQPFNFFRRIYEHIISQDKGIVVLCLADDRIIAAAVFFHFGEHALYKYGASDRTYQNMRANNLVMWEAIKWYSEKKYTSFSFGRTDPENRGLLQFKDGWNTQRTKIAYYRYNLLKYCFEAPKSKTHGIHKKVFERMPASWLNTIGSILYKHIG